MTADFAAAHSYNFSRGFDREMLYCGAAVSREMKLPLIISTKFGIAKVRMYIILILDCSLAQRRGPYRYDVADPD
jgi:hypothetical protein